MTTTPKLSVNDVAGVSTLVSGFIMTGTAFYVLFNMGDVAEATVLFGLGAAAVTKGVTEIWLPASAAPDVQMTIEDFERAIVTRNIAATIPKLSTDVLKLYQDAMTAHAAPKVPIIATTPVVTQ